MNLELSLKRSIEPVYPAIKKQEQNQLNKMKNKPAQQSRQLIKKTKGKDQKKRNNNN